MEDKQRKTLRICITKRFDGKFQHDLPANFTGSHLGKTKNCVIEVCLIPDETRIWPINGRPPHLQTLTVHKWCCKRLDDEALDGYDGTVSWAEQT
jgi:hypothetical protein